MKFGVLKDIKEGENRVICTPVEVASIVSAGHTVYVQKGAGVGAGRAAATGAGAGRGCPDSSPKGGAFLQNRPAGYKEQYPVRRRRCRNFF